MAIELANILRQNNQNFVIIVEDDYGIHSQISVHGDTPIREVAKTAKRVLGK